VGPVPDKIYFENISEKEYSDYVDEINVKFKGLWDAKEQVLIYNKMDTLILKKVMIEFNKLIFNKFNVNINKVKSISGLSLRVLLANFYSGKKDPIMVMPKSVDLFIRNGYYGGIVDTPVNYIDQPSYRYDANSHYPAQFSKVLPGGLPRKSDNKDLNSIFGFVNATVFSPNENELKNPILPVKVNGKTVLFRGQVTGTWFSEELKDAVNLYGYKLVEIHECIEFDRVIYESLSEFASLIYNMRLEAKKDKNEGLALILK
jgi:hypothetical protein